MGKQVLVFRPANVQQTGNALQRIKERFPDCGKERIWRLAEPPAHQGCRGY